MSTWPAPEPGDIVWCRFPELPHRTPGPKPRPALVLKSVERTDGYVVTVVYGTSQKVTKLHRGEFSIIRATDAAAYQIAGLSHDTKFDFKQVITLPWTDDFFAVPPQAPHGQSPKLGVLHPIKMRAAQAAHQAATTSA